MLPKLPSHPLPIRLLHLPNPLLDILIPHLLDPVRDPRRRRPLDYIAHPGDVSHCCVGRCLLAPIFGGVQFFGFARQRGLDVLGEEGDC